MFLRWDRKTFFFMGPRHEISCCLSNIFPCRNFKKSRIDNTRFIKFYSDLKRFKYTNILALRILHNHVNFLIKINPTSPPLRAFLSLKVRVYDLSIVRTVVRIGINILFSTGSNFNPYYLLCRSGIESSHLIGFRLKKGQSGTHN